MQIYNGELLIIHHTGQLLGWLRWISMNQSLPMIFIKVKWCFWTWRIVRISVVLVRRYMKSVDYMKSSCLPIFRGIAAVRTVLTAAPLDLLAACITRSARHLIVRYLEEWDRCLVVWYPGKRKRIIWANANEWAFDMAPELFRTTP